MRWCADVENDRQKEHLEDFSSDARLIWEFQDVLFFQRKHWQKEEDRCRWWASLARDGEKVTTAQPCFDPRRANKTICECCQTCSYVPAAQGRTVSVTSKITKYSRWSGRRVSLLFQADIRRVDDNGHGKQPARISKILPERSSQALRPTGPSATGLQLQHLEFRKKGVINHWRSPMVVIVTINRTMGEKVLIMFGCITLCNLCIEKAAKHSLQQGKRNKWGHTKSTHTHTLGFLVSGALDGRDGLFGVN